MLGREKRKSKGKGGRKQNPQRPRTQSTFEYKNQFGFLKRLNGAELESDKNKDRAPGSLMTKTSLTGPSNAFLFIFLFCFSYREVVDTVSRSFILVAVGT